MKQKVIAVVGPTASGKTKLAIELAQKMDGEIISADSMQVYTGMDIGTAKIKKEEISYLFFLSFIHCLGIVVKLINLQRIQLGFF